MVCCWDRGGGLLSGRRDRGGGLLLGRRGGETGEAPDDGVGPGGKVVCCWDGGEERQGRFQTMASDLWDGWYIVGTGEERISPPPSLWDAEDM